MFTNTVFYQKNPLHEFWIEAWCWNFPDPRALAILWQNILISLADVTKHVIILPLRKQWKSFKTWIFSVKIIYIFSQITPVQMYYTCCYQLFIAQPQSLMSQRADILSCWSQNQTDLFRSRYYCNIEIVFQIVISCSSCMEIQISNQFKWCWSGFSRVCMALVTISTSLIFASCSPSISISMAWYDFTHFL